MEVEYLEIPNGKIHTWQSTFKAAALTLKLISHQLLNGGRNIEKRSQSMEHKDTARISSSRYYKTPHVTTVKSPGVRRAEPSCPRLLLLLIHYKIFHSLIEYSTEEKWIQHFSFINIKIPQPNNSYTEQYMQPDWYFTWFLLGKTEQNVGHPCPVLVGTWEEKENSRKNLINHYNNNHIIISQAHKRLTLEPCFILFTEIIQE
jgi:hypothetical protein